MIEINTNNANVRQYVGFAYIDDSIIKFKYYSRFKNFSTMNKNDMLDTFYKKYGLDTYKKVKKFDFGGLI